MGFLEALTLILLTLKLLDTIDVSWWLVFLPVIISVSFYIFLFILYVTLGFTLSKKSKKSKK